MKRMIIVLLILLLPVYCEAAYRILLKNGSVIPEVKSYDEKDGEVTVYFEAGSMVISKNDILKIEGSESLEKELQPEEKEEVQQKQEKQERPEQPKPAGPLTPTQEPAEDKSAKLNELKSEMDSINSEIRSLEERENNLAREINEKTGSRSTYNLIQMKQLEKEVEPLRQELSDVQKKKGELMQRRNETEEQIRQMQ